MVKYSPIESEFGSSEEEAAYDAWFRAKVERSLASTKPHHTHEAVMARAAAIIEKAKSRATDLDE